MSIPPVTPAAGTAAETFLSSEVAEARRSLRITRITSAIAALFVLCYLGYITHHFQESMQPDNAAQIAQGVVAERVDANAGEIADQVKQRVPTLIAQVPDYAIKQMPEYRQRLEDQIIGDISGYSAENAPKLGDHLDDFLQANKDEVKQLIEDGQNPEITDRVGAQLQQEFMASLKDTDAGNNETYREKLDKSLASLQDIHQKMDRLAANKNLTPSEMKTRRAIAILAGKITLAAPTVATNTLSNGAATIRQGIGKAVSASEPAVSTVSSAQ